MHKNISNGHIPQWEEHKKTGKYSSGQKSSERAVLLAMDGNDYYTDAQKKTVSRRIAGIYYNIREANDMKSAKVITEHQHERAVAYLYSFLVELQS